MNYIDTRGKTKAVVCNMNVHELFPLMIEDAAELDFSTVTRRAFVT